MAMSVKKEIQALSHKYVRHGGKTNRKQQVKRLLIACDWVAVTFRTNRLAQIGNRQIIEFYKNHRHMTPATLSGYYYAFCTLWEWLERAGKPPKPHVRHFEVINPLDVQI